MAQTLSGSLSDWLLLRHLHRASSGREDATLAETRTADVATSRPGRLAVEFVRLTVDQEGQIIPIYKHRPDVRANQEVSAATPRWIRLRPAGSDSGR